MVCEAGRLLRAAVGISVAHRAALQPWLESAFLGELSARRHEALLRKRQVSAAMSQFEAHVTECLLCKQG